MTHFTSTAVKEAKASLGPALTEPKLPSKRKASQDKNRGGKRDSDDSDGDEDDDFEPSAGEESAEESEGIPQVEEIEEEEEEDSPGNVDVAAPQRVVKKAKRTSRGGKKATSLPREKKKTKKAGEPKPKGPRPKGPEVSAEVISEAFRLFGGTGDAEGRNQGRSPTLLFFLQRALWIAPHCIWIFLIGAWLPLLCRWH